MSDATPPHRYGNPAAFTVAPTLLTLVRHGQTTGNIARKLSGITDDPLTPFGERQATATGMALAALVQNGTLPPVDALYVSPLIRARRTAAAIATPFGLTPIVRADLSEVNFGDMEGLTETEAIARFPDAVHAFGDQGRDDYQFPGGESRPGFQARARDAVIAIVAAHPGAHVIVVAHGGVLAAVLAHYLAGATRRWRDYLLGNCSLSRLTIAGGDVAMHCVNDLAHLADLTPEEREAVAEIEEAEQIPAEVRA